jgi:hypothetical protein
MSVPVTPERPFATSLNVTLLRQLMVGPLVSGAGTNSRSGWP